MLVKIEKWEQRIPNGSLGDGIWRILCLILSLIGAKDGILLIDEIDTGYPNPLTPTDSFSKEL